MRYGYNSDLIKERAQHCFAGIGNGELLEFGNEGQNHVRR